MCLKESMWAVGFTHGGNGLNDMKGTCSDDSGGWWSFASWFGVRTGTCKDLVCVISHFSHVWLFATLWTVAHQALLSMGFSKQEYWSGLPCPPLGDLPNPGMKPVSLASSALVCRFFTARASQVAVVVKNSPAKAGDRFGFGPWIWKIPWRRKWQPTAVFLPGESHGQRSLAGYSPWGHTQSDMTDMT